MFKQIEWTEDSLEMENEEVIILDIIMDQCHFDFLFMMSIATEITIITFRHTIRPFRTEFGFIFGWSINLFYKVMGVLTFIFIRTGFIILNIFT